MDIRALWIRCTRFCGVGRVSGSLTRARHMSAAQRGFTLIELLVVTGILIIITGLVLANHSRFGGKILLENLAYDMALTVRQAQVYGISVRSFGTNNFAAGYGMHFATAADTSYVLFADGVQTDGMLSNGETVQTYTIDRGYRIEKLCAPAGDDILTCTSVPSLDVLYKRPEPDAYISAGGNSCITVPASNCLESARIGLVSPAGDHANIVVDVNGQIAVNRQ